MRTKIFVMSLLSVKAMAFTIDSPIDRDPWFDITVLSAHVVPNMKLGDFDKVENCQKVEDKWVDYGRGGNQHLESFDCTDYVSQRIGARAFKPVLNWNFTNGKLQSAWMMDTPIVEILTVVPLDRLEKAAYLGFSESAQGGRVNLFKANGADGKTMEVGKVTLKDGRVGVVHKWFAPFMSNGTAYGHQLRNLPFKPVLVREENGNELRYWDKLIGDGNGKDYEIRDFRYGNTPSEPYMVFQEPNSYNRSVELLK